MRKRKDSSTIQKKETGKNTGYTLQNRQAKKQIFQVHHPTMQKMYR